VMQAVAVQTSPRVTPGARKSRSLTVFTPQMCANVGERLVLHT
jgi:hypothetical protein